MRNKYTSLTWTVKNFNCNRQCIEDYDILKHRENFIKKLKKKCVTKKEFAIALHGELQYQYWSRAEYELVIEVDGNNQIWLNPWCGCSHPEDVRINVTNDDTFDWRGFAEEHISRQRYKNKAKIDIFDQLMFANQFDKLVDYCWYTHLKWERKDSKFDE